MNRSHQETNPTVNSAILVKWKRLSHSEGYELELNELVNSFSGELINTHKRNTTKVESQVKQFSVCESDNDRIGRELQEELVLGKMVQVLVNNRNASIPSTNPSLVSLAAPSHDKRLYSHRSIRRFQLLLTDHREDECVGEVLIQRQLHYISA